MQFEEGESGEGVEDCIQTKGDEYGAEYAAGDAQGWELGNA